MYTLSIAPFAFTPARRSEKERVTLNRMALPKGSLLSVIRPQARTVECTQGLIWITHDNEPHDIFLSAGQRYCPTSKARMLVQALEKSDLRIEG